ncbi:MAG: hypothetical protein ABI091_13455, partial [Ferruginibacter sp.]
YPGTVLQKYSVDLAANYNITKKLKVSTNVHIMNSGSDDFPQQSNDNYQYQDIYRVPNSVNLDDFKDYWAQKGIQQKVWVPGGGYNNPYFTAYENINKFNRVRAFGDMKVDYEFNSNFNLMARLNNFKDNLISQAQFAYSDKNNAQGAYSLGTYYNEETNADFLLSYKKQINDFSINASGGGNLFFRGGTNNISYGKNLTLPDLYTVSNIQRSFLNYSSNFSNKRINSLYGVASIDYKKAIYLSLTGRNDWSSTLPVDNRSYFYPSASMSVIVSDLISLPKSISFLKFRGGWAQVGKDTDPYQLTQTLGMTTWGNNTGYSLQPAMIKQDLKPEKAISTEAGFDLSLFENRLGFGFTYYKISNRDQILNINVPDMSGYTAAKTNAGIVDNSGIEIELNAEPVRTKNIKWDLNFSFTKESSTVKQLAQGIDNFEFWSDGSVYSGAGVGDKVGDVYANDVLRVPDGKYKDWPLLDGNGYVQRDPNFKKYGNVNPDFTLGFQTSVSFKRFTLSASFDWRQGGVYYSVSMMRLSRGGRQENWYKGAGSSTFTGILSDKSYDGNSAQLVQEISDNPGKYNAMNGLTWVGGRTQGLGGFPLDGRNNGAFFPGVTNDGSGGYAENFGGAGTKFFRAGLIADPGAGYWSQGAQTWLYSASFIKMRELALSYGFPQKFVSSIKAQSLSISLFMKNLILWTEAKNGIDPETAYLSQQGDAGIGQPEGINRPLSQGFDRWNVSPWTATVGLKLNVQF